MQRARDRRRGEREDVGLHLELFQTLFVLDPESMLLIDNDQPEIRELHVGTEQPMRSDNDVDLLCFELGENVSLLFAGLETADRRDTDREVRETFRERS